jgi:hypothetical protein
VVGVITASDYLKAGDVVTINVDDNVFAGALQLQPGVTLNGNVTLTGNIDAPSFGALGGIDVTVSGTVLVNETQVLQVNDLSITSSGTLDLGGGGRVEATVVINNGAISFGHAASALSTGSLQLLGPMDLAGAGTLELFGSDAVLSVGTGGVVTSAPPNGHRVVVDNGIGLPIAFQLFGNMELDTLVVGDQGLTANGGTLQVGKLELAPDASVVGVSAASCTGLDGNSQANCP